MLQGEGKDDDSSFSFAEGKGKKEETPPGSEQKIGIALRQGGGTGLRGKKSSALRGKLLTVEKRREGTPGKSKRLQKKRTSHTVTNKKRGERRKGPLNRRKERTSLSRETGCTQKKKKGILWEGEVLD